MTAEIRARVVAEALTWLGTPYRHRQRVKGEGVDCAQILAAVYEAAGVIEPLDLGEYATQWHLHHEREVYLEWLEFAGAVRVTEGDPLPADVGVWKYGLTHSHGGIVVEGGPDPVVVHSYIKARRGVTLGRASEEPLKGAASVQYWRIIP